MSREMIQFKILPAKSFILHSLIPSDYMSGSFLVSYLMGKVIFDIKKQEGKILLPHIKMAEDEYVNHPILNNIVGKKPFKMDAWLGTIPNALYGQVPYGFKPFQTKKAFERAWFDISKYIWKRVFADNDALGNNTREIWKRQVSQYWQFYWTIGPTDSMLHRSLWNTYAYEGENGHKCQMFNHLQELSGHTDKQKRLRFWKSVNEYVYNQYDITLQLNKGDHTDVELSAIGLIKRLLPVFVKEIMGWPQMDIHVNQLKTPYSLIMIDCDRAGEILSHCHEVSNLLITFLTELIHDLPKYDAEVIYAGGDECLIKTASLKKGIEIAGLINARFQLVKDQLPLTLSASVVLADLQVELRQQVNYLRWSLKHLVKEKYGGDSILVSKWTGNRPTIIHISKWRDTFHDLWKGHGSDGNRN